MIFFQGDSGKKNKKRFFVVAFVFLLMFSYAGPVAAVDTQETFSIPTTIKTALEKAWDFAKTAVKKAGSVALQTATRNALNQLAYDTATWIGSGNVGQKPLYVKEELDTYLGNVGDDVVGGFIENIDEQLGVDFCNPDVNVKLKIGLGLLDYKSPQKPDCTISKLRENWGNFKDDPDFIKRFSASFEPSGNDLGAALLLQSSMISNEALKKESAKTQLADINQGWLDIRDIGGNAKNVPGQAKSEKKQADDAKVSALTQFTGDALVDATNIFLNQLAISSFNNLMRTIGDKTKKASSPYDFDSLFDSLAGPGNSGVAGSKATLSDIIEPKFDVRGDYDILAELTICNENQFGVGPTDCVIEEKFRQGIESQSTVAEAIAKGFLKPNAVFGFKAGGTDPIEPSYQEGYPYRSLLILRKYRIIPVGWELAAEYINEHSADSDVSSHATLGDMVACFSDKDIYDGYHREWCQGLVDPSWVLKAPQNYCAKEGYGPEIVFQQEIYRYDDEGKKTTPELIISRDGEYCSDEQSCISENDDGSCNYFGYCTEEKRTWRFDADSCQPIYNSCQSFISEDGDNFAYLKNTLDYCEVDQQGCERYATGLGATYNTDTNTVNWGESNNFIYLNKEAVACDEDSESCSEFIRISPDLGTNLLYNSGFEEDEVGDTSILGRYSEMNPSDPENNTEVYWSQSPIGSTQIVNSAPGGRNGNLLRVFANGPAAEVSSHDHSGSFGDESILPEGFVMEPDTTYTLSAEVYLETGDELALEIGREGGYLERTTMSQAGQWNRVAVTIQNNDDILANYFRIRGSGGANVSFYLDNVKFEVGGQTPYSTYRANNIINQKIIPDYLADTCYVNAAAGNYTLKNPVDPKCNEYARQCNLEEVGCELFTDTNDDTLISAKVNDANYCSSQCVGYDNYIQAETTFADSISKYLIPETASTCSAEAVGCEEFTDLDESTAGAEKKVYFSYLRQCVKPIEAGDSCQDFYSWQGDDVQGQQLVKYTLEAADNGEPALTSNTPEDQAACNADIYTLSPSDPAYNPDCREFYNTAGQVSYHLYSKTITCSDDCHPYRLNREVATPGECKEGGTWNETQQACIYNAFRPESVECGAAENGCKQYNGNQGNDTRILLTESFENGAGGWTGGHPTGNSVVAGQNSYVFDTTDISLEVGYVVNSQSSYVLSFIAKGLPGGSTIVPSFRGPNGETLFPEIYAGGREWQVYETNISAIDHDITSEEMLSFNSSAGVYIDSIKLTQITDRYYLIEDSENTPAVCDQDPSGNPYPYYSAGCSEYNDRFDNLYYLSSFDQLCQESAAGCELVIDTDNYTPTGALYNDDWNTTLPQAQADTVSYIVYDPDKQCNSSQQSCELLGETLTYEGGASYANKYIKNDPDDYDRTACGADGVGCDKFSSDEGNFYFKDPKESVCEWRRAINSQKYNWFKKRVKRCDTDASGVGNGSVCLDSSYCGLDNFGANIACLPEVERDETCPVDNLKTIGQGGLGNEILQPQDGWVGSCPAEQSSCTEYIDPVSEFSENLIDNPDFSRDIDNIDGPDSWDQSFRSQQVSLEGNNLYIMSVNGNNTQRIATSNPVNRPFYILDPSANTFGEAVNSVEVGADNSIIFYLERSFRGNIVASNLTPGSKLSIKKAIIDYQSWQEVDKETCSEPNVANGCIYFDERSVRGLDGLASLTNDNYSNTLIKVRPDRVCNEWLDCKGYIKDEETGQNVCFDLGTCDRLDANGNCANFKADPEELLNSTFEPGNASLFANASGYAKVGSEQYNPSLKPIPNNLYSLGDMLQLGSDVAIENGSFDEFDEETKLVNGWYDTTSSSTNSGAFKVVADPLTAQQMGIDYPRSGPAFLRYSASTPDAFPTSGLISISQGVEYYISFDINTLKLGGGDSSQAEVTILDADGERIASVYERSGRNWITKIGKFENNSNGYIQIRLGAISSSGSNVSGAIFIDDIKITPVLGINSGLYEENEDDDWLLKQTCRLYPAEDSLSCEYKEDTGIRKRGDYGYCLEYDRYPGNPDTCLLWWPIDKVKGSSLLNQNANPYAYDKKPLYYCLDAPTGEEFRPYIDASETFYAVEEWMSLYLNGESLVGHGTYASDCSLLGACPNRLDNYFGFLDGESDEYRLTTGSLSEVLRDPLVVNGEDIVHGDRIYLNYGINEITVGLRAKNPSGSTFALLAGHFYYYDSYRGTTTRGTFNISNQGEERTFEVSDNTTHDGGEIRPAEIEDEAGSYGQSLNDIFGGGRVDETRRTYFCDFSSGEGCNRNTTDGDGDPHLTFTITIPEQYPCTQIAQVVNSNGENKAWMDRIADGSDHSLNCNPELLMPAASEFVPGSNDLRVCLADTDDIPFGSLVPPTGGISFMNNPSLWDSILPGGFEEDNPYASRNEGYAQPIFYQQSPFTSNNPARMGQLHTRQDIQGLFAMSYGIWDWVPNSTSPSIGGGQYIRNNEEGITWTSPDNICPDNNRANSQTGSCFVRPIIRNIQLNGAGSANILQQGWVNLTFNSVIDKEQLPLRRYEIDWGDGDIFSVSGEALIDKPNADTPHSVYKSYSYEDLIIKYGDGSSSEYPAIDCSNNSCVVKPKIKIIDNWGVTSEAWGNNPQPSPNNSVCVDANLQDQGLSCSDFDPPLNSSCSANFPICADGWQEPSGSVIVYRE